MDIATFAFILGVWEVLIGVPLLLRPRETFRWLSFAQDNNDVVVRLIGALFLVVALLALWQGMAITGSVVGIVRLLAWITAVKCLMLVWCPHLMLQFRERLYPKSEAVQRFIGLVAIGLGVFLLWASCAIRGGCCAGCCEPKPQKPSPATSSATTLESRPAIASIEHSDREREGSNLLPAGRSLPRT